MMLHVRTTLTIDDDLAGLLRRKARELDKPFKQLVNDALRRGLTENSAPASEAKHIKTRPHSFGFKPGIDPDRLNQLADELEVEEFARKHRGEKSAE